jgi:hypothetical protein
VIATLPPLPAPIPEANIDAKEATDEGGAKIKQKQIALPVHISQWREGRLDVVSLFFFFFDPMADVCRSLHSFMRMRHSETIAVMTRKKKKKKAVTLQREEEEEVWEVDQSQGERKQMMVQM